MASSLGILIWLNNLHSLLNDDFEFCFFTEEKKEVSDLKEKKRKRE